MRTLVAQTERGPVEYSEAGSGDPILYFHGTGITGDVMAAIEAPVAEEGFRLIVPNRPGYGRTPLSPHHSATDCAGVAAALLDSLGIADAGVMGSSGGAAFAASFAINHPSRARSLVLLCPQLHRWDHKRWLPRTSRWTLPLLKRPLLRKALLALYRLSLPRMSAQQFLKTEAGERFADVASDLATQRLGATTLAAMALGTRFPGFANDFAVFLGEDILGRNRSLHTPTLILHDVEDPVAPVDHVEWFVSAFPHCERVSVGAAGHLIWAGPGADDMHRQRVRFLREHARRK
jgi:pimeloyl-ACP methyl ester carboxylesterase